MYLVSIGIFLIMKKEKQSRKACKSGREAPDNTTIGGAYHGKESRRIY